MLELQTLILSARSASSHVWPVLHILCWIYRRIEPLLGGSMSESIAWICRLGSYRRSTVAAAAAAAVATALRSAAVRQTSSPARKTSPLGLLKKRNT